MLYSPQPAASYSSGNSGILAGDPEAWNLAWLSHGETFHPDPHFTTLVRRTVQVFKSLTPYHFMGYTARLKRL